MEFPSNLKKIAKLSDSFSEEIENFIVWQEVAKGKFLFEQGKICRHIFFIDKGLFRVYYYANSGKDITAWFSAEQTYITAIDSFYHHKPTNDFCEALEDSIVYTIKYSDFELLLDMEDGARLAFHVMYEITKKMTEFITSTKFQSAESRYNALIKDYPSILQRAPLGYIASYLGITQETLSRIRAGK